jgi:hypothetical protein
MVDPPSLALLANYAYDHTDSDTLYGHFSLKDPPLERIGISGIRIRERRNLEQYLIFHIPEVEDTHVPEETGTPDHLSLGSEEASSPLSRQR